MSSLLYVTKDILEKLRQHPAYQFWWPFVQHQPVKVVPIEERAFHPRELPVENDAIYLTVELKFVYCRSNQFSFMYEDQDLSFRLNMKGGILRTVDGKQFSAVIGKVARATGSADIELLDTDHVFHPLFDHLIAHGVIPTALINSVPAQVAPPRPRPVPKPVPLPVPPKQVAAPAVAKVPLPGSDALVLGKYSVEVCDKLVAFRLSSKKSFTYLATKFGVPAEAAREICELYQQRELAGDTPAPAAPPPSAPALPVRREVPAAQAKADVPADVQQKIIRLKTVSKKSYDHLAAKFNLPVETVRVICGAPPVDARHA